MLRLLHTADLHLGARHADLGERAAALRERSFAAFAAAVDLAIAEKVDLVLVAGDLFDSNVQPRRSVERVGSELARLVAARIRTVILPGTHDVYDRSSIYRAHDLPALAGSAPAEDWVVVLTPDRPDVHFDVLNAVVHGPVFPTKRAPYSPLRDLDARADGRETWQIGMVHGSIAIPGRTAHDEVVIEIEEIAASGLDYLALGHWHSAQTGKAGATAYAYSGAPEPVAVDQDRAGQALLVTLKETKGVKEVRIEERRIGRTRYEAIVVDATEVGSQPALVAAMAKRADPDLILDLRVTGVRPDDLDLHPDEIEAQLKDRFFGLRVRDVSLPGLTDGPLPSEDTIIGAFIRDVEGRVRELDAADDTDEAAELRDALRLGRLLLAGHEVTL